MNDLRHVITSGLESITPPPGDLVAAKRMGGRQRRRRRARHAGAATLAVAALGLVAVQLPGETADRPAPRAAAAQPRYMTLASFDVSSGLRAFADPAEDGEVHLGDKSFPRKDMRYLDTDAVATPDGVLFFDRDQKPRLLGEDGRVVELGAGPDAPVRGARPAPKVDSVQPLVAWVENHGTFVRAVVYDLSTRTTVRTRDVPCSGASCSKVTVDAVDRGVAYVRTPQGTFTWRTDDSFVRLGSPSTRVVDVRGSTMLWAGQEPSTREPGWTYAKAPIDAQLTFDGKNILYWSSVLAPVRPGDRTLRLDRGSDEPRSWYALDSDGSVLVAVATQQPSRKDPSLKADVFDCELPSGACTGIGKISTESGDPEFIGTDSF